MTGFAEDHREFTPRGAPHARRYEVNIDGNTSAVNIDVDDRGVVLVSEEVLHELLITAGFVEVTA